MQSQRHLLNPAGEVVDAAEIYVRHLLSEHLDGSRTFHNLQHTLDVVHGVRLIGGNQGLAPRELEVVTLAAWFHDTGHTVCYVDHESASVDIARAWLGGRDYPADAIEAVVACIQVTRVPQRPHSEVEAVMCDADLYHLTFGNYVDYADKLRKEWHDVLRLDVSDEEWRERNEAFLRQHHYFSSFGRHVLEGRKRVLNGAQRV